MNRDEINEILEDNKIITKLRVDFNSKLKDLKTPGMLGYASDYRELLQYLGTVPQTKLAIAARMFPLRPVPIVNKYGEIYAETMPVIAQYDFRPKDAARGRYNRISRTIYGDGTCAETKTLGMPATKVTITYESGEKTVVHPPSQNIDRFHEKYNGLASNWAIKTFIEGGDLQTVINKRLNNAIQEYILNSNIREFLLNGLDALDLPVPEFIQFIKNLKDAGIYKSDQDLLYERNNRVVSSVMQAMKSFPVSTDELIEMDEPLEHPQLMGIKVIDLFPDSW